MKKKSMKKFFAGMLSAVMALSVVSTFTVKTSADTIDTTKNVSLTIKKYEYTSTGGTDIVGTGSSTDTIPYGAKGLNDVEFTVYKIADIEHITEADGTVGIKYKTLTDLAATSVGTYVDGGMTPEQVKAKFITDTTVNGILNTRADGTNKAVKTTVTVGSEDGIAEFKAADLDGQGLYLVVETDKPAKVTSEMAPFLVSLPTTFTTDAGSTWLYDVYAFPKNSTKTSAITLVKHEKIADELGSTPITGATFYLQMKVGTTWVTQTKNANGGDIGATDGLITVSNTAGVQISYLAPGEYRFIEKSASSEHIVESDIYHTFSIDTDGVVSIPGVSGATMTVLNDKPTVEKDVLKKGTTDVWGPEADYST